MGKFMKSCAWAALVLVVVGLVLAMTAGTVKGGEAIHEVVNKATGGLVQVNLGNGNGWGLKIGEKFSGIGLEGVEYDMDDSSIFDNDFEVFHGEYEDAFAAAGISKLDVEAGGCSLTVKESEDDSFHVEAEGTNKFQCYQKDNTLHIKGTMKTLVGNNITAGEIVLAVPAGHTFEKVNMEVGAGFVQLSELNADKFDLEVGAGQIVAESLIGGDVILAVGVGECIVKDMKADKLDAEVNMGNLDVKGTANEKIMLECAMGNITMTVDGAVSEYDYNVECGMGNVTIGDKSFSGASDGSVNNGAARKIDAECAMGNIEIFFTE